MGNPSNSMKCPEILDIDSHIYLSLPKKGRVDWPTFGGDDTNHPNIRAMCWLFLQYLCF